MQLLTLERVKMAFTWSIVIWLKWNVLSMNFRLLDFFFYFLTDQSAPDLCWGIWRRGLPGFSLPVLTWLRIRSVKTCLKRAIKEILLWILFDEVLLRFPNWRFSHIYKSRLRRKVYITPLTKNCNTVVYIRCALAIKILQINPIFGAVFWQDRLF